MNSEKSILPSLRNKEWRIDKTETNNINQVLHYISTNNITKLNDLINAEAKLICEKIGIPSNERRKNQNQDRKIDWKRR